MNLNKTFINSLTFDGVEKTYFDDVLKGFGVRVGKSSASYIVMYRNVYGKQKKITIAKTTQIAPAQARDEAKKILALVVQGKDPASDKIEKRKEMTVADLADKFLTDRKPRIKASSFAVYSASVRSQILPAFGNRFIKELRRADVQKFYNDMVGGAYMDRRGYPVDHKFVAAANHARKTLCSMYEFAIRNDWADMNPAIRLDTISTAKRMVFLDEKGFVKFGNILQIKHEREETVRSIFILLALTGCRRSEITTLKWEYVDFDNQAFRFPDTKTGAQNRPFGSAAKRYLLALKEKSGDPTEGFLFKPAVTAKMPAYFATHVKPEIGITGFCLHALRHSFASMAAALGYSDNIIAGLLGHHINTITNRYTHLTEKVVVDAANVVSEKIAELIGV